MLGVRFLSQKFLLATGSVPEAGVYPAFYPVSIGALSPEFCSQRVKLNDHCPVSAEVKISGSYTSNPTYIFLKLVLIITYTTVITFNIKRKNIVWQ
jgi:hypothetical protein